jgi:hypothetical protein
MNALADRRRDVAFCFRLDLRAADGEIEIRLTFFVRNDERIAAG